ncbi:nicotinic acid mononucleotide adenylyltransferase [Sutcliffiella cohnii]|uniref:Probable nicotinate-nucleotide adenylyltransferase n=1 Tax=Sutcliffiella cohnii TaxID=33932 RepID=A0A223KT25_9BACI|nr:nicotinate-nucleotide adenylyltransferase [Sutcliffiella cohnii]AST92652.1 nicotinic acid mononucleotide adenylyltransferase [Sutcliffiella cohnii]
MKGGKGLKIGIFGGTFDPPHIGHLIIANEVKHRLSLDEIWFMPNRIPPHKQRDSITSTELRIQMIETAINHNQHFRLETIELDREGPSYSYDTIVLLLKKHPDKQFNFIIGADMVEYLPHWYKIDELINKVQFVGVKRPGYQLETPYPVLEVETPLFDVSSTNVRERVKEGKPIQYFVPQEVEHIIEENRLYGKN